MVTAVANVLTDLGGPGLSGPGLSGPGASGTHVGKGQGESQGESMFAQLLEGMGESIQPVPATVEAPLLTAKDEVTAADTLVQNIIPMLAEPIVIQIPVPTTPISSSDAASTSLTAAGSASLPTLLTNSVQTPTSGNPAVRSVAADALVPGTPSPGTPSPSPFLSSSLSTSPQSPSLAATASPSAPPSPVSATASDAAVSAPNVDLQWLRAMTGAARGKPEAVSTPALSVASVRNVSANAPQLIGATDAAQSQAPQPGHDLENTPSQTLIQMLAQASAAPVMVATVPRDDRAITADVASPGDTLAGITPSALQPAGTALAEISTLNMPTRQHLQAEVGTQAWAAELGNKLTMIATRDTQSATLYMTPADLGPVQVRIEMKDDQASVWFTAEHPETRTALEQALPRLREMFTAQGMSLTDAGVFGNRSQQQSQSQSHAGSGNTFAGPLFAGDEAIADTATVRSLSLSLLDTYA